MDSMLIILIQIFYLYLGKRKEKKKQKLSIFPNNNSNIKSVTDYKPSGNLIYNNNILKDINKKKNYLLN